jgi:uncharacterized SAM-binding protein YcdF (DUF218 family)
MSAFALLFVAAVFGARAVLAPGPAGRRAPFVAGAVICGVIGVAVGPSGLILQKVVGRMALPLGLLWTLLLLVTVVRLGLRDRRGAGRSGLLAVAVTVLGNQFVGEALMAWLERPYRHDPFAEAPFDAVVVLGGGTKEGPHPHYELRLSGDRVLLGARLQRAGKTAVLVTTGTAIEGFSTTFDGTAATRRIWEDVGVPPEVILQLDRTRTTGEEASRVAEVARARGWRRIGLVTSAWHMRRAERLFRAAGVDVVPLAADHLGTPSWEGLYSLVPIGYGAWLQQKAVWELLGAAAGR